MEVPRLAKRISNLGTETAMAVSLEAQKHKDSGKNIYAYHIGDLNFAAPACVKKAMDDAIADGKTGYCAAAGILPLRQRIAEHVGAQRGVEYTPDNVSVQSGGKPVIGKFFMTTMDEGDEVLYPSPGYPIYESQINYLGGVRRPYTYKETKNGFVLDLDYLKSLITPKTKLFVYNNYSNPMGVASSEEEMAEIAKLCVENNLLVLSDEAYFDLVFDNVPKRSIVSFPGMKERSVILFTFSKSYAMTGWRLGAAVGPVSIITQINRLNTNDESCTTHFIQHAGIAALSKEGELYTAELVKQLAERRDALVKIINEVPGFHCHPPPSTFYLFVNVTEAMQKLKIDNYEVFRKLVLEKTGLAFCTREHFGAALPSETQKYVRFAYSGINVEDIMKSGAVLKEFMESSLCTDN